MIAHGADLRSGCADNDVATVSALPDLDLALGEDGGRLHVVQQGAIALLVMTFDLADHAEAGRQLRETFGLGRLGKAVIHVRPLVVFTLGSRGKIFGRIADACQLLEPQLGMLLLVVRRFEEQRRDLLVALASLLRRQRRCICCGPAIRLRRRPAGSFPSACRRILWFLP